MDEGRDTGEEAEESVEGEDKEDFEKVELKSMFGAVFGTVLSTLQAPDAPISLDSRLGEPAIGTNASVTLMEASTHRPSHFPVEQVGRPETGRAAKAPSRAD